MPKSRYIRVGRTLRGKRIYENVQRRRRRKPVARTKALARKGLGGKIGAAAVGAVAAQALPGLGTQISAQIPITYGAILGVILIMNKRSNEMVRYAGFGMILGGGVVQWMESLIGPQLSNIGAAPGGGAS